MSQNANIAFNFLHDTVQRKSVNGKFSNFQDYKIYCDLTQALTHLSICVIIRLGQTVQHIIVGETLLFSPTASLFVLNKAEINNGLHQQCCSLSTV